MSNAPESFSERLRRRVEELGITHAALGKGLKTGGGDLGRAAVHGWLSGNTQPSAGQLAVICERLQVSADYLLFGYKQTVSPKVALAKTAINQLSTDELAELRRMIPIPTLVDVSVNTNDGVNPMFPASSQNDTGDNVSSTLTEWITKEKDGTSGHSNSDAGAKSQRKRSKGS